MPDLLAIKATELSLADFDTLSKPEQERIIELVEQDYLAYLFLHNSNAKMHSQLIASSRRIICGGGNSEGPIAHDILIA